ncbi:hypothetical protein [Streptomyces sp. Ncost-T10-10d]|uniref:hypothetical protein n=1 Tax=Streptomyces sp. Ncost-T10-10d TaxID=1839774 RepID=UPI00081D6C52|nr:hypothetical protein [Streptomyces sp. Ncost-T10-10d]SCF82721.1 hypothetical protein GA0115254_118439 [Streptomyces sp. Ncost-T10-10d]
MATTSLVSLTALRKRTTAKAPASENARARFEPTTSMIKATIMPTMTRVCT